MQEVSRLDKVFFEACMISINALQVSDLNGQPLSSERCALSSRCLCVC